MSERIECEWVYLFNSGQTNIHDEERSSSSSVVSDEPVEEINETVREDQFQSP